MHDTKMTEPTDRLKIRESGHLGKNTAINASLGLNFTIEEFIAARQNQESHISFARFYHEHQFTHAYLSAEEIYGLWQEKSREK